MSVVFSTEGAKVMTKWSR